jgi:TonB-dependent receptor
MKAPPHHFLAKTLLSLLLSLAAPAALAAELYLSVFIGTNPLEGLEVELDGRFVGLTGSRGDVLSDLDGGKHTVNLLKDGASLATYAFEVADGENAEISFSFSDFQRKPAVAIDRYRAGDSSGAAGVLGGVVSNSNGEPVAGARLSVEAAGVLTTSADDGSYELEIPRGSYELAVTHPEYRQVSAAVRVIANVGVIANVIMRRDAPATADAAEVDEIVVIGSFKPAGDAVSLRRSSIAVTDAINIDDLLRYGDSDVAASLRRIVGVSVTGGRYAVVRGLDGRYIASTLNGNLMPSTDPFRRDVQLDLFPNDILGSIEIQKTFTADMPGDTTGGIIKIRTRDLPEGYINSLSAKVGYTTGVTGDDLLSYRGSGTDRWGFDDGLRSLPGAIDAATDGGRSFRLCQFEGQANCATLEEAARLASLLPNIYSPQTRSADPNWGLAYSLGNVFDRDIGTVGFYGSASFDSKAKSRQNAFRRDLIGSSSTYQRDELETALNAYLVVGIDNERWTLLSKTMLLRASEDVVEVDSGIDLSDNNQSFLDVLLEWEERQFLAQQFEGKFVLPRSHELNWRAGLSQSTRDAPDTRSYQYRGFELPDGSFDTPRLRPRQVERAYAELTEDGVDLGLDYLLPMSFGSEVHTDFRIGVLYNRRDRESDLVRIGFNDRDPNADLTLPPEELLTRENFEAGVFELRAATDPTDFYEAEQENVAVYLNSTTNIGLAWTVVAGIRHDDFEQTLAFPNANTGAVSVDSRELLPSLGLIWRVADDWQLRAGYSNTVSRPNITENAPTRFFDERGRQFNGCTFAGAPVCEPSKIDNYDLRAEYYFNGSRDSASLALFHKDITKPIERAVPQQSDSLRTLTFRNNQGAQVSGVELDVNLTAFERDDHRIGVGGNVAFIDSKIELDSAGQQLEGLSSRELQGQSPFLANLQIGYDHFASAQKLTLVVNYFDDRIDIVTRGAAVTPVFEKGRASVNASYEKSFGSGSSLSFLVRNLFDDKVEYEQNGQIIESYKEGVEFSLGYSHKF